MKLFMILAALFFAADAYSQSSPGGVLKAEKREKAVFAAGCFWGVENKFEQLEGVINVFSGYTGGTKINPSYTDVCTGETGHAEAVEILFDPEVISYEELVRFFFTTHDFTHKDRRNPAFLSQYRSGIFYRTEQQKNAALSVISGFESKGWSVHTEVSPAGPFWKAEEYHQDYIKKLESN